MRTFTMIVLLTVLVLGSQPAIAADCSAGTTTCCDRCGRHAACVEKACQVVCEMKKETKTCWQVECVEMCPLMPGCRQGCSGCCNDCKSTPSPRCGHPKCVKKLVKKEYQVEVPSYKCVVCHLCPDCCNDGSTGSPTAAPNTKSKPTSPALPPQPSAPLPPSKNRQ
jgi:hypothetical protein